MTHRVSSGQVGLINYLIIPNDNVYNAVITTPSETIEVTCDNWKSAQRIVKKTIKRIEENDNENGRTSDREEGY